MSDLKAECEQSKHLTILLCMKSLKVIDGFP